MILLFLILIPSVWSCPSTTTTTTTTPPPHIAKVNFSVGEFMEFVDISNDLYPNCPKIFTDCKIAYLKRDAMQKMEANADLRFHVEIWKEGGRFGEMYLDRNKTFILEENYMSYLEVSSTLFSIRNSFDPLIFRMSQKI